MNKHIIPRKFEKIRIGNNKDGGYVLPKKCVDESDLCISFGLGNNITYEKDLLNRNKKVIGHDIALKVRHPWARQMKLDTYEEFSNISEVMIYRARRIVPIEPKKNPPSISSYSDMVATEPSRYPKAGPALCPSLARTAINFSIHSLSSIPLLVTLANAIK
jgi:hypothetical protein